MARFSTLVLIAFSTFAVACDETETVVDSKNTNNNGVEQVGGTSETNNDAEVEYVDAAAEEDPSCSFSISEGFGNYETTVTDMTYTLVGESEIQVHQGETVNFTFAVAANTCGDALTDGLTIVVSNDETADWVTTVDETAVDTRLVHITGNSQINGVEGTNCNSAGYDRQIFYEWDHTPNTPSADAYMDEVFVGAGESEQFRFYFAETESIPVGTIFEIYLLDPSWDDLESGADVWDTYYYMRQGGWDTGLVGITVTVVE